MPTRAGPRRTSKRISPPAPRRATRSWSSPSRPRPTRYLGRISRPVPILADESVHDRASLDRLVGLYEVVNIKLDKTGGLTEALALADAAEARGFSLMIGCMVGSSLAMAPALVLAPRARFVDLDGPLLLARTGSPACATRAASSTRPSLPSGAEPSAGGRPPASARSRWRPRGAIAAKTPAPASV